MSFFLQGLTLGLAYIAPHWHAKYVYHQFGLE